MTNNFVDNIMVPAREMVKNDSSMKKFYFLPWLLSMVFLSFLLVYQSIYTYVEVFWKKEEAFVIMLKFFHSDYVFHVGMFSLVFLMLYLMLTPMFEWGLMSYMDNLNSWEDRSYAEMFWSGMYSFFPLFEYNNMFSEFKFMSMLNGFLFSMSFMWTEHLKTLSIMFWMIFFMSMIMNSLFSYSKYEMVLWNKKTFEAAGSSSKMAMLNMWITMSMYFLMFLFNISVMMNFMIFLTFPIAFMTILWLMTSTMFLTMALVILSLLFMFFMMVLWYLTAVLDVFKASVWYFAYMEWKKSLDSEEWKTGWEEE